MKKLLLLFLLTNLAFAQVDTTFYGLRGYEDLEGNTHLFYQMKSSFSVEHSDGYYGETRGDFFHYNLYDNVDSIFLVNGVIYSDPFPASGQSVRDFEFIDNTLTDFYQCGDRITSFEPVPVVIFNREYDNPFIVNSFHGITYNLEITKIDTNVNIYVSTGGYTSGIFTDSNIFSFDLIHTTENYKLLSVNRNKPNEMFVTNDNGYLLKSNDTGFTFALVDNSIEQNYKDDYLNRFFLYDSDSLHIYRVIENSNNFKLVVSDNLGDLGTWREVFQTDKNIFISYNSSKSGEIYFTNNKEIYKSENYGVTYNLVLELDKNISGIYKKPNSDLLYVTTPHKLLEIKSDSIKVLKQLIDYETISYFPLQIGNKWFYNKSGSYADLEQSYFSYDFSNEITKDTVTENGNKYFYSTIYGWIRIESLSTNIYTNYSFELSTDLFLTNLGASVDQQFQTSEGFNYDVIESDTLLWELSRKTKSFLINSNDMAMRTFAKGIGIIKEINFFDFGNSRTILKGCIINGKIYGDTTVVGIDENKNNIQSQFSLSQNYPNPFNPITTIEYNIPTVVSGFSLSNVSLKVFDVLGREITTLVNERQKFGKYKVEFDASNLTSGIYYYSLLIDNNIETRKMILLK